VPRPIIAGNWKMNTTVPEAVKLASDMKEALASTPGVDVVLCPPFVSLDPVSKVIQGTPIMLGAQNMYHEEKGAFTGEISPLMLKGLCQFVILGHSERRHILGEGDEFINRKVKAALKAGLRPILCVGETRAQRDQGQSQDVVREQLERGLEGVEDHHGLVVAYEPVWAIGTGIPATPDIAQDMMGGVILGVLGALFGEHAALEVALLYGGSVTADNIAGFVAQPAIHGALVGGASLRPDQFVQIVRTTAEVKGGR